MAILFFLKEDRNENVIETKINRETQAVLYLDGKQKSQNKGTELNTM